MYEWHEAAIPIHVTDIIVQLYYICAVLIIIPIGTSVCSACALYLIQFQQQVCETYVITIVFTAFFSVSFLNPWYPSLLNTSVGKLFHQ